MSAKLRTLAAASGLGTFTAKELASEAAAPLATVRNLLQREAAQFEIVGEERGDGPGRPGLRYRLVNPAAVAAEIAARREQLPAITEDGYSFSALHEEPSRRDTELALLDAAEGA